MEFVPFFEQELKNLLCGYVFHPDVLGLGYAAKASRAMLDLAFGELGLHRVTAIMDARNTASARLAGRLGMRAEAHHVSSEMFKGEWVDTLVFALLARGMAAHPASGAEPLPGAGVEHVHVVGVGA